ncbi:hypothetical protein V7114_20835 [Neobacillus niacini]|uniref:hypothetical protein n=1 Tax=Neobacillus niacini TaxID=86668 RepID=UPI0030008F22
MRPIIIRRQYEHEARQAIADLLERGFEITYPLTEIKRDGKRFTTDSFNRKIFVENIGSSCWIAKLRKIE